MANVFLRPRHGLLREVVDKAEFQTYMSTYGDVKELWIPWKEGDRRCFGFATFNDPEAAMALIHQSPHAFNNNEVIAAQIRQRHAKRPCALAPRQLEVQP